MVVLRLEVRISGELASLGGSFKAGGEDICGVHDNWMAVLGLGVRILGCSFRAGCEDIGGAEDIWVAVLGLAVRISG